MRRPGFPRDDTAQKSPSDVAWNHGMTVPSPRAGSGLDSDLV